MQTLAPQRSSFHHQAKAAVKASHPDNAFIHNTDSIRPSSPRNAHQAPTTLNDALEKKGDWRERFAQWREEKLLQLKINWEQHYTAFRKDAMKVMMGLAAIFNCLPMPNWLRGMIERKYFFSPRKVSSSYRLKSQELRQKIDIRRFHPEGNNTYELDSWYIAAQGDKPTVVFSHGRDCNISHLEPILKALSDKGYGVFVYDYPGFGRSEGMPSEEALYEAGVAACKYLAGDGDGYATTTVPYNKQILMGHSLGGAVAVDIAKKFADDAKLKDRAQRIFNRHDKPELQGQPQALILINTFTDLKEAFADKKKSFHSVLQRLFNEHKIRLDFDSKNKLPNVTMPIMSVHGDKDSAIQAEIGGKLFSTAHRAPQGRFHLLPNVNHKLKDDMCAEIIEYMTAFLNDFSQPTDSAV